MKKKIIIIFPHQLFKNIDILKSVDEVILIEETLYFNQYDFHKVKLAFHRASMQYYRDYLLGEGIVCRYIHAHEDQSDIRRLIKGMPDSSHVTCYDPVDNWLLKRMTKTCNVRSLKMEVIDTPAFINSMADLSSFFRVDKKKFHQTSFYKAERKRQDILMDGDDPKGGNWTYDTENRKKYPKGKTPPNIHFPETSTYWLEAVEYVSKYYGDNPGLLSVDQYYPITHDESELWLQQFLDYRFHEFGPYEDAVVSHEVFLHHSILSPLINCGLLLPDKVISQAVTYAEDEAVPINSVEGFVRQIMGWREFIRGIYIAKGTEQRNRNFWKFERKMPAAFYTGETGIPPIDDTIKKVIKYGYCHHIERLMILANFMTLCEIDPDDIYRWFMELFIDAYDWVMVPNVYGMATFSDGGLMSTKPYISSSNYVKKMSDYGKGSWGEIWDSLFWRFMHLHRDFFASQPRLGMLLRNLDKMSEEKLSHHIATADAFLENQISKIDLCQGF